MSDVFAALSDSTRRAILERLREEGPLTLKGIAEPLSMSRQAVTKHLGVLESAGLLRVERSGRERIHQVTSDPLREVDDWLEPFAAAWAGRLERLQAYLEREEENEGH